MNLLGSNPNPVKGSELAKQALALAQSLGDIRRQADALDLLAWDHRDFKRAFSYWEKPSLYIDRLTMGVAWHVVSVHSVSFY
jgi:hypothetical protein